MKTDTLKKSLLDYAIKGSLTAKFRRENNGLNAFNEITTYNEAVKEKRKNLEKELKKCEKEFKLEKDKDKKAFLKQEIQTLKKELTKCKEITPLNLSEAPFEIPNSWAWVKLGDICEMKKGPFGSAITKDMFIPNGNNAVKIYEQKNAIQKSETLGEYYISLEHFEKLKQFEVFENDIIVSCAGTIGEIFRIPKNAPKGIINQALMKIKLVNEEWIPYFMIFFDFLIKQKSQENSKGSAIKNIPPLDILKNFSIPLPPLREQQEIVGKLDLLVTLANDFAITKENLKRIEKRIEKSLLKLALEGSLSKLYRRSSPTLCAFDEISTYNDNIKQKRKDLEKKLKICEKELKLEKDKDKKALFKSQIQMLKKELTKCKEIIPLMTMDSKETSANAERYPLFCHEVANATSHNDDLGYSSSSLRGEAEANHTPKTANRLPQVSSETLAMTTTPPFTIPNSWAWVKLGDICEIVSGGTPSRDKIEYWHNGTIPWVKIADVKNNVVNQTQEFITELGLENSSAKIFKKGTLLYTIFATLGETAILNIDAATNQAIAALIEAYDYDTKFLMYCLMSMKDYVNSLGRGVAQNNINQTMLKNFSIPLPPLCEQEHIVQTLDTLFTLKKGLRVD
ncbi:restriction endonuclease subunit S [Campylobacter upsaliensis]|uniref:restriction endonuclease subunit S n=1 Tax=Campylobacter upsaliensis TaxID=28080 RepID=UPI0022EA927D|nr:restriction endonuclease subunit S [Campylobacter upsaliensis]